MVTVVITGTARGLGLELVRQLAADPPLKPMRIIAGARKIPTDVEVQKHHDVEVHWQQLDISDEESVAELVAALKKLSSDGVDVLINNAAIYLDPTEGHSIEVAVKTMNVNYNGTLNMVQTLLPLMKKPAHAQLGRSRIVNISSLGGKLFWAGSEKLRQEMREVATMQHINALRDRYLVTLYSGMGMLFNWPILKSYGVSKALVNIMTRVIAAEHPDLLINCCCPGWIKTDMGDLIGDPVKSLADGAKTPLYLAFGQVTHSGEYFENPSASDTGVGVVADWTTDALPVF